MSSGQVASKPSHRLPDARGLFAVPRAREVNALSACPRNAILGSSCAMARSLAVSLSIKATAICACLRVSSPGSFWARERSVGMSSRSATRACGPAHGIHRTAKLRMRPSVSPSDFLREAVTFVVLLELRSSKSPAAITATSLSGSKRIASSAGIMCVVPGPMISQA